VPGTQHSRCHRRVANMTSRPMRSGHRKRSVGRVRPARNLWMELSLCGAHGAWSSQRARFALRVSLSGGCVRRGPACVPLRRVSVCVSRVATLGPEREATMGDLMCYVVLSVRPSGCTAAAARTLTTRACGVKTVSKLVNLTRRDRRAPDRTERAPDRPTDNRISWGAGAKVEVTRLLAMSITRRRLMMPDARSRHL
jgi:hypothetical protein